jgi:ankyrin repeat protein
LSDINAPVEGRNSLFPLLYASGLGCSPAIELLLAHPEIQVNQERASDKTTPLLMAVQYERFDVVKLLLSRSDIDVNKADKRGITPLRAAIASGYDQMIDLLLACSNTDVNRRYSDGTILYLLAKEGYSELVRKLLKSRPDINCDVYFNGHTPLDIAIIRGHDKVVQIFKDHTSDQTVQE